MIHLPPTSPLTCLLAANQPLGNMLMGVAIVLVTASLLLTLRKRKRRMDSEKLQPGERLQRNREIDRMNGNINQMMVELEALTRRFSAQLDAKSLRLEKLLEEADRKIALLQDSSPTPQSGSAGSEVSVESPPAPPPVGPSGDPLVQKVYDLADAGQPTVEIARQLDEQVGKVELILALRQS